MMVVEIGFVRCGIIISLAKNNILVASVRIYLVL